MRSALFLVLLATGPSWAASGLAVPRYPVEAFCRAQGDVATSAPACLVSEDRKRVEIVAAWNRFPVQRRHFCIQSVRFLPTGAQSYSALWQCLSSTPDPTS